MSTKQRIILSVRKLDWCNPNTRDTQSTYLKNIKPLDKGTIIIHIDDIVPSNGETITIQPYHIICELPYIQQCLTIRAAFTEAGIETLEFPIPSTSLKCWTDMYNLLILFYHRAPYTIVKENLQCIDTRVVRYLRKLAFKIPNNQIYLYRELYKMAEFLHCTPLVMAIYHAVAGEAAIGMAIDDYIKYFELDLEKEANDTCAEIKSIWGHMNSKDKKEFIDGVKCLKDTPIDSVVLPSVDDKTLQDDMREYLYMQYWGHIHYPTNKTVEDYKRHIIEELDAASTADAEEEKKHNQEWCRKRRIEKKAQKKAAKEKDTGIPVDDQDDEDKDELLAEFEIYDSDDDLEIIGDPNSPNPISFVNEWEEEKINQVGNMLFENLHVEDLKQ